METDLRPSSDLRDNAEKNVDHRSIRFTMKSELELLRTLADAENDVAAGRIAPVKDMFSDLKPEVIDAMEEAKALSRDPSSKRYTSFSDALEDIDLFRK